LFAGWHRCEDATLDDMSDPSLPELRARELTGTASRESDELILRLEGTADSRFSDDLSRFVVGAQEAALAGAVTRVVIDFRDLEFMNSSCFKSFVTWLQNLMELPPERQYQIRFVSDPSKHWQARSLKALSCFAADLVEIVA
jgi:hypothetical protein